MKSFLKNPGASNSKQKDSQKPTLIVTGHSLGGALSPTIARWVNDFNPGVFDEIYALPVAGPTPGNGCYQQAWDKRFKPGLPEGSGTINQGNLVNNLNENVWCTSDIVPHAWKYIYKHKLIMGASNSEGYYFEKDLLLQKKLNWPLGSITNLETAAGVGAVALLAQIAGDEANMTVPANQIGFGVDWTSPPCYFDLSTGNVDRLARPNNPFKGTFHDLLAFIALIHVWSYGQSAFNVPFEFWEAIAPITINGSCK